MILNDRQIEARIHGWDSMNLTPMKTLGIKPFRADQLQPSSYDVLLGPYFRVFDMQASAVIDPLDPIDRTHAVGPVDEFILHPHEFALGCTAEYFEFPDDLVGHLDGKSSLGRLGLVVHATAGYFDPGFSGHGTLELANVAPKPIILRAGMLIGQMNFHEMEPTAHPYGHDRNNSKYVGQTGPTPSQYFKNYPDGIVPKMGDTSEGSPAEREVDRPTVDRPG